MLYLLIWRLLFTIISNNLVTDLSRNTFCMLPWVHISGKLYQNLHDRFWNALPSKKVSVFFLQITLHLSLESKREIRFVWILRCTFHESCIKIVSTDCNTLPSETVSLLQITLEHSLESWREICFAYIRGCRFEESLIKIVSNQFKNTLPSKMAYIFYK